MTLARQVRTAVAIRDRLLNPEAGAGDTAFTTGERADGTTVTTKINRYLHHTDLRIEVTGFGLKEPIGTIMFRKVGHVVTVPLQKIADAGLFWTALAETYGVPEVAPVDVEPVPEAVIAALQPPNPAPPNPAPPPPSAVPAAQSPYHNPLGTALPAAWKWPTSTAQPAPSPGAPPSGGLVVETEDGAVLPGRHHSGPDSWGPQTLIEAPPAAAPSSFAVESPDITEVTAPIPGVKVVGLGGAVVPDFKVPVRLHSLPVEQDVLDSILLDSGPAVAAQSWPVLTEPAPLQDLPEPLPPGAYGRDESGMLIYRRSPVPSGCETCSGCSDCLTYNATGGPVFYTLEVQATSGQRFWFRLHHAGPNEGEHEVSYDLGNGFKLAPMDDMTIEVGALRVTWEDGRWVWWATTDPACAKHAITADQRIKLADLDAVNAPEASKADVVGLILADVLDEPPAAAIDFQRLAVRDRSGLLTYRYQLLPGQYSEYIPDLEAIYTPVGPDGVWLKMWLHLNYDATDGWSYTIGGRRTILVGDGEVTEPEPGTSVADVVEAAALSRPATAEAIAAIEEATKPTPEPKKPKSKKRGGK